MSRAGKQPVQVANNVKVNLNNLTLEVTGPKGTLKREFVKEVSVEYKDNQITVTPIDDSIKAKAMWGLTQRLISLMVKGVSEGFTKELEIEGVGFKAAINNGLLNMSLGFSHEILYAVPAGITVVCEKPTLISISGHDKQLVGQVAAEIRSLRKPEPYKGKGIRYKGEKIRRKEGKKK
jgi:large subunit ribosomal protein L6